MDSKTYTIDYGKREVCMRLDAESLKIIIDALSFTMFDSRGEIYDGKKNITYRYELSHAISLTGSALSRLTNERSPYFHVDTDGITFSDEFYGEVSISFTFHEIDAIEESLMRDSTNSGTGVINNYVKDEMERRKTSEVQTKRRCYCTIATIISMISNFHKEFEENFSLVENQPTQVEQTIQ